MQYAIIITGVGHAPIHRR